MKQSLSVQSNHKPKQFANYFQHSIENHSIDVAITISFLGADPTLKDSSGHTAVEYAGSTKIKELLNDKMETVCIH